MNRMTGEMRVQCWRLKNGSKDAFPSADYAENRRHAIGHPSGRVLHVRLDRDGQILQPVILGELVEWEEEISQVRRELWWV